MANKNVLTGLEKKGPPKKCSMNTFAYYMETISEYRYITLCQNLWIFLGNSGEIQQVG